MRNLEKGQHIFIAFQNGKAVLDSQLRPRIYTSLENADKWTPTVNKGKIEYVEYAPTLTPPNEWLTLEFDVVDTTTGKYPDWERIAREEAWAKGLVYCDMDGIAIREDGSLILLDECGNCVSCPPDRFEIRRPPEGEEDT